jgi:hypothetical protein
MIDSQYVKKENPKIELGFPKLMRLIGNHGVVGLFTNNRALGAIVLSNTSDYRVGANTVRAGAHTFGHSLDQLWEDLPLGDSIVLTNTTEF